MFIAQTPHIDPLMFHLALQQNAETDAVDGAEKTAFAWYAQLIFSECLPFYSLSLLHALLCAQTSQSVHIVMLCAYLL